MNKEAADNLYLMGFMGSGKTTVSRSVAQRCKRSFCDMDEEIEKREGMTISQIFAEKGEAYFRKAETELLTELLQTTDHIVALGGGTVIQEANRELLKQAGAWIVWLDAEPEAIYQRLKGDHSRPLLEAAESEEEKLALIKRMMKERQPIYEELACKRADMTNRSAEDEAFEIAQVERVAERESDDFIIWVINGPNLNFLGIREPEVYGSGNYHELVRYVEAIGMQYGMIVRCLQSNHEGDLIDYIQDAYRQRVDGIVLNPGALTHYSYALRDAIASVDVPVVEVHLSDIQEREAFRQISVTKEVCIAQISGFGFQSYKYGMREIAEYLQKNS